METEAAYAAKGSTLRLCSYMYHIGLFELELFELYEFSLFQAIRWWTAGEKFRSLFSAYDLIRSTPSEHRALHCKGLEQANMRYTIGRI